MSADDDIALRINAIAHVEAISQGGDGILRWEQIEAGFEFRGEQVLLANRTRGIFWPARLRDGALSIKTTIPRVGRVARYDDSDMGSGAAWFEYRYQGQDPASRDNVRLRQCLERRLPVIYFYGVSQGQYRALLCHVVGDEPSRHTFHVAPVESSAIAADPVLRQAPIIRFERRYELALVRRRLHQDRFRAAVMEAYRSRCAICRLRREPLLDAAHIIPDREKLGEAMVPNGLALCKLHHAAFDGNLLGVSPDLKVQVSEELRTEKDGPMLAHGLVAFDGSPIGVPEAPNDQPNRDLLAERFERFLRAE